MRDQVLASPAAILSVFDALEEAARLVLPTPNIFKIRRIIITGSGDSLFAAKSVEMALAAHASLPVRTITPLEAGRYLAAQTPEADARNTLAICVSNSGEAARVVEAALALKQRGFPILAVSKSTESRLGQAAGQALSIDMPRLPSAPGFGAYTITQIALLLLAIRIGEVRLKMTMDVAQDLRGQLKDLLGGLDTFAKAVDVPMRNLAEQLVLKSLFEFAAPNVGVAEYGAAKVLEATGRHALARDLEEWMHLNYFDATPTEIATFVIAPEKTSSRSRLDEVVRYMTKLGREVCLIGQGPESGQLPSNLNELWSGLYLSAPLALFAAHLSELDGAEYCRGAQGVWDDCADASTVQKGKILVSDFDT